MKNAYYSISNFYPLPFSGCTHQFLHVCLTRVTGLGWTQKKAQGLRTAALQTSTRLRVLSYTEQLRLDPTKYSPKSTGAALQKYGKKYAGFLSTLPKKSYAVLNNRKHSTALFSQLPSTYRKPVLNPSAQTKIPFHLPFIFIFTWKGEKSWAFMHNKWTGLFCSLLDCGLLPPTGTHTWIPAKISILPFWFKHGIYLM